MTLSAHVYPQSVEEVFAAVADPRTYPHWLIGARDIRSVDDRWPAVGSSFHHRVGLWGPLKVSDRSTLVGIDPPRLLRLVVRARPVLRAEVQFELEPRADGRGTLLRLEEHPMGGYRVAGPLIAPLTAWRNRRSLTLLADLLATGRSHRAPG